MALSDMVRPLIGVVIAVILAPIIIGQFGNVAAVIDNAFAGTIDLGGVQVEVAGLAKLIVLFASIVVVLAMVERFLR